MYTLLIHNDSIMDPIRSLDRKKRRMERKKHISHPGLKENGLTSAHVPLMNIVKVSNYREGRAVVFSFFPLVLCRSIVTTWELEWPPARSLSLSLSLSRCVIPRHAPIGCQIRDVTHYSLPN